MSTATKVQLPGFYITGQKGFHVTFANGWTVSVQFGGGNYCDNREDGIGSKEWEGAGRRGCGNAEVAAWGPDSSLIDLGGDTVRGWVRPAAMLALLVAAENGDLAAGKIPDVIRRDERD